MIISPALGTYICDKYNDDVVVFIATAISFLDVLFILVMVPESLPSRLTTEMSWKKADPFAVCTLDYYLQLVPQNIHIIMQFSYPLVFKDRCQRPKIVIHVCYGITIIFARSW